MLMVRRAVKKKLLRIGMMLMKRQDRFSALEIETINRCNGSCSFCPANHKSDKRKLAAMDDGLIAKIIEELASIHYKGFLGLQSNNEPLLDKKIIERIEMARRKCPEAFLYMYTNGTLLDIDKMEAILKTRIDMVTIDNYSDKRELNPNIKIIDDYFRRKKDLLYETHVQISIIEQSAVRTNRGGTAPNKNPAEYKEYIDLRNIGCFLPFKQMVIRPDGKVSLCCQDALGQVTLGDVSCQGLIDVWRGAPYERLRNELLHSGRGNLPLCKYCDLLAFDRNDVKNIFGHLFR